MKFLSCISIVFIVSQLLHCVYSASSACTSRNERVKKALIYRNGEVLFSGFYHVLLMVVTQCGNKERYHLLDLVKKSDGTITINHRIHDYNYCRALEMRNAYNQCVRPCSRVYYMSYGTMDDIYRVINNYEGQEYEISLDVFGKEVTGRNCITFVKDILSAVGKTYKMECGKRKGQGEATRWRVPGRPRQTCETYDSDSNC